jgi:hypothetical protein
MDEPPGLFELMSWTAPGPSRAPHRATTRPRFVDTAARPAEPPDEVADLARRRVRTAGGAAPKGQPHWNPFSFPDLGAISRAIAHVVQFSWATVRAETGSGRARGGPDRVDRICAGSEGKVSSLIYWSPSAHINANHATT